MTTPERVFSEEIRAGSLEVKISRDAEEIFAAQKLRYRIFFGEMGGQASNPQVITEQRDFDAFDEVCDHLLVIDHSRATTAEKVVGCYRLLRKSVMPKIGRFYSESEFEISPIKKWPGEVMELGRSCVHENYRNRAVMQLLWRGIGEYVATYGVELMFGCASFTGINPEEYAEALSYLYHFHLAPPEMRSTALPQHYVNMNLMPKEQVNVRHALNALPPLIKGYLRLSGFIGDGAFIDPECRSIDVGIIVKTDLVTEKYARRYQTGTYE